MSSRPHSSDGRAPRLNAVPSIQDSLPEFHFTSPSEPVLLSIPHPDSFTPLCPSARTSYTRVDVSATDDALGVDDDLVHDHEQAAPHPQVAITFLLVSGRRRTMSFDPETTVGRVKELAWNAWPNEWQDERPPAPSFLRILYLGKILQDDDTLTQLSFPTWPPSSDAVYLSTSPTSQPPPATIVHLSIRAYAPHGADDAPKKKRRHTVVRTGSGSEDEASCCSARAERAVQVLRPLKMSHIQECICFTCWTLFAFRAYYPVGATPLLVFPFLWTSYPGAHIAPRSPSRRIPLPYLSYTP
ncbi:ubiquitin-related domain-containing protein [Sparassis latifolia]